MAPIIMMWGTHILRISIAMSLCTAAHVQAGAAYPRVEGSITLPTLAAQLVQSQDVATWLAAVNLAPAELGRLSAGEHAEMMESMRAAEITLGDRFRLRVLAEAAGFAAAEERPETHGRHEQRQLQEDATKRGDGLSSDSIALMVTAFLGVGSFIVQVMMVSLVSFLARASIPIDVSNPLEMLRVNI
jgi:hypothetical protein